MTTREAKKDDLTVWANLRHALWPGHSLDTMLKEAREILYSEDEVCFLLMHPSRSAVGFVEACIHPSRRGPYCHVEGWYVMPEFRGKGQGKRLIGRIEGWSLHRTICLMTSDTEADYPLSTDAHARAGFKKMHELTIFVKELQPKK